MTIAPGTLFRAKVDLDAIEPVTIRAGEIFMYLETIPPPRSHSLFATWKLSSVRGLTVHQFLNKNGERVSYTSMSTSIDKVLERNPNNIEKIEL